MSDDGRVFCPKCGGIVSTKDTICRFCGHDLSKVDGYSYVSSPSTSLHSAAPVYQRRFGLFGRLYRFFVSPSEAMRDVALAPDYGGVFAILFSEVVLVSLAVGLVFTKFQLVGTNVSEVSSVLSTGLVFVAVLAVVVVIVRWAVKSALVYAANGSSIWGFKTAAAVTGYAYFADVVVVFVGLFVIWLAIPSVVIDTSSLQAAQQSVASLQASATWIRFAYTLPVTFIGVLWKSYLGGLGTHHGTNKASSLGKGFIVFLLLGLIGVVLDFVQ